MEILVAILIIAVIAAVVYAVMQRKRAMPGAGGIGRSRRSPLGRSGAAAGGHPMAAAVADHAAATEPQDVIVAEQRLQAQASQISARLQGQAHQDQVVLDDGTYAADPRMGGHAEPVHANGYDRTSGYIDTPSGYSTAPPTSDLHLDDSIDPETGRRVDGYDDPNNDPRLGDSRYDGRLAADYVDPATDPDRR